MDIEFKLNEFSGPLDLLLHLIKQNKMDIMNIEVEKITDQYMAYLSQQEKMNLEIASEYLVLASELLEIKSKLLLPHEKILEEDLEEIDDPRSQLVHRLLEYQAYKEITKVLQDKENVRKEIYTKTPDSFQKYVNFSDIQFCGDVNLDDLILAFRGYLERKNATKPLNTKVTMKEITVTSRRHDIRKLLKEKGGKVSFFELFPVVSKEYIVATFLAILEMAKNQELVIVQNNNFDEIICEVAYAE